MTAPDRWWARPELVAIGRLPMTTFLRDRDGDGVVSLDGPWALTLLDRPGGDVRAEATVEVPGCWTMQGLGDPPQYTNIQMPFPGPPPQVPDENPTGVYRRRVEVPAAWAGQRVVLHVGGAETALLVELDGRFVGLGTDSRLPQEFDLTDLVDAGGTHELTLTVVRWGAATYLEDQDHWHHAGLHRSVLLYATPPTHVADVHPVADRDPATGEGHLAVDVLVGGPRPDGARVRALLDGEVVAQADVVGDTGEEVHDAYLFARRGARLTAEVGPVAAWSAEHPHLHDLRVELVDGAGAVLDATEQRVGFRRVEVRGHELLVNGRAVLIKGVNRHDHDPRRGKAVTREAIRHDVELMKAHNLNALRTSHYPNDPYLYEVCDELGLYVVDEADIEAHAYMRWLTKQPEWAPAILERVARMARRDKGHPSIVMWSLGNEAGWSPAFDAAAAWLRGYDPTRPLHYENGYLDEAFTSHLTAPESWRVPRRETDVIPPMYPDFASLETWAAAGPPDRPFIMCEYAHAMNNSCGDLDRYWDLIRSTPGMQGGFVWDWVDQALVQDVDGTERLAYGGDFGDTPHDGVFCLNGLVDAHRVPHPSLVEAAAVMAPVRFADLGGGTVQVTNEHDFTDLAEVADVEWAVTVDGDEVAAGSLGRLAVAPGASVEVTVPLPELALTGWQVAHLTLTVGDVASGQVELGRSEERAAPADDASGPDLPTRLSLWRAPIDNETFGPHHAGRWRAMELATAHERVELGTERHGDLVTHEVTVPDDGDDIPRVGVRLALPPEVTTVEWVGRGPHECYSDRRAGALVGRWRASVDDWPVPYVHPQASGNRTDVREVRFLDAAGAEVLALTELADLDVTVSRWTDEEVDAATHLEDLPARDHAFVWVDARHRGVGSAAVGPDVSAPHRIGPGPHRWSYRLRAGADASPGEE